MYLQSFALERRPFGNDIESDRLFAGKAATEAQARHRTAHWRGRLRQDRGLQALRGQPSPRPVQGRPPAARRGLAAGGVEPHRRRVRPRHRTVPQHGRTRHPG